MFCAVVLAAAPVHADFGIGGDGDLVAIDEVPVVEPADEGPAEVPVVCTTSELTVLQNDRYESGGYVYAYVDARYFRFDPDTGASWVRASRTCRRGDEVVSSGIIWELLTDPDPELVASVLRDRAAREIAPPSPSLSPSQRGVVQLGMWLAVNDPGPYEVTASATPGSWVTARAELTETRFDMGNGDVVVCAGAGDPIPDDTLDSLEPSPECGYTYRELDPDGYYVVTITSTWSVTWTSSRGTSGTQPPIVLSTTLEYPVVEIQSVGVAAD
jgi:hypothetical protein